MEGDNRGHAVLGGSDHCIAVQPSDLAVSLPALDATVITSKRRIPFADFSLLPGATPGKETLLDHGDLITSVEVPRTPMKSHYLKLRDRTTFEFAVVSVAAALDVRGRVVRDARLAFGGVATTPWRVEEAEAALRGKPLTEASIAAAGEAAVRGAVSREHNGFKVELLKRAISVALKEIG